MKSQLDGRLRIRELDELLAPRQRTKEIILKKFFRRSTALACAAIAVAGLAVFAVSTATASTKHKTASVQVCVLLPDTKSSVRWVQFDAPAMKAAFAKAGVTASINNALNDPLKQKAQAQACIAAGATVVIETALDNGSAASIEKLFTSKGGKAIDYDRQVTGGTASVYVTFDGKAVGEAQAKGVLAGMKANGTYRRHGRRAVGRPDRPERVLVQERQRRRLQPALQERRDQEGPAAVRARLGCEQRGDHLQPDARQDEQQHPGRARGERQHRRRRHRRPEGEAPEAASALRSGCVASQGVQNIISGWQSGTVYKYVPDEANAAAAAAVALIKGQKPKSNGSRKPNGKNGADPCAAGRLDHEGQLHAPLHGQVPEEERRVRRHVQAVLQVGSRTIRGGGASRGASTATK